MDGYCRSERDLPMNRELAKKLKAAGFPIPVYQVGHRFFPHEKIPDGAIRRASMA
jgi:hypothetical protein